MKLNTEQDRVVPPPPPASTPVVLEAIVKQQAIAGSWNRSDVTLAPHVLYTRHDELFIDAVTLERDGKPPKEPKLGTFKLAGVGAVRITPRRFGRSELFVANDPKYAGVTLMAIDAG